MGLGSGEKRRSGGGKRGEGREGKPVEDRWKFDSGRKGRINGAGGTHRGHKSPARPGITGSQLAKYDGLINPSPLARAPPSTTSAGPAPLFQFSRSVLVPLAFALARRERWRIARGALSWRIYVSARRATAIYNLRAWKSEVHNLIRSFRSAWGGEKGVKQRTRYGVAWCTSLMSDGSAVACRDNAAPHVFS